MKPQDITDRRSGKFHLHTKSKMTYTNSQTEYICLTKCNDTHTQWITITNDNRPEVEKINTSAKVTQLQQLNRLHVFAKHTQLRVRVWAVLLHWGFVDCSICLMMASVSGEASWWCRPAVDRRPSKFWHQKCELVNYRVVLLMVWTPPELTMTKTWWGLLEFIHKQNPTKVERNNICKTAITPKTMHHHTLTSWP